MEGKAERGWLPSRAPMGYLNDKLQMIIYEDPERFTLVRKMWDMMLTGNYTVPKLLGIVNNEWGFRTPKTKRDGGKELSLSGIYRIFTNIFYTGNFMWSRKLYQGNHKIMITAEEYDRVQIILGRKGKPRPKTHEFSYTGLIRCGVCGSLFTAYEKTKLTGNGIKTYVYYACNRKKKGVKCDQVKPVTLKEIEDQIDFELERNTISPKFKDWAVEILNRDNDKEIQERTVIHENASKAVLTDTERDRYPN